MDIISGTLYEYIERISYILHILDWNSQESNSVFNHFRVVSVRIGYLGYALVTKQPYNLSDLKQ